MPKPSSQGQGRRSGPEDHISSSPSNSCSSSTLLKMPCSLKTRPPSVAFITHTECPNYFPSGQFMQSRDNQCSEMDGCFQTRKAQTAYSICASEKQKSSHCHFIPNGMFLHERMQTAQKRRWIKTVRTPQCQTYGDTLHYGSNDSVVVIVCDFRNRIHMSLFATSKHKRDTGERRSP